MTQRTQEGFEDSAPAWTQRSQRGSAAIPAGALTPGGAESTGSLSGRFTTAIRRSTTLSLSLETCLWLVLVVGAAVSRFWDLGYRALHHDESLHAYYSWVFAEG
ncbi:MAG: hypothetical protein QM589_08805, partial [Thermomicrobiales bacterium]